MSNQQFGALVRAVRLRRGLLQHELAAVAGVGQTTSSLVERGHCGTLSLFTLERIARPLDIRVDVTGRWRGGDADRLLNRRHSELAASVAAAIGSAPGWGVFPEVSFSIFGERGGHVHEPAAREAACGIAGSPARARRPLTGRDTAAPGLRRHDGARFLVSQ